MFLTEAAWKLVKSLDFKCIHASDSSKVLLKPQLLSFMLVFLIQKDWVVLENLHF